MTRPALWTTMPGARVRQPKARRRIRPVSDAGSLKLKAYRALKGPFLRRNRRCQRPGCHRASKEVHHTRGRAGALLTAEEFWLALCRRCHCWVHDNPGKAREAGLLCQPGEWNKVPR